MKLSIDEHKGEAIIIFDDSYRWVALDVHSCRTVAAMLLEIANRVDPPTPMKAN